MSVVPLACAPVADPANVSPPALHPLLMLWTSPAFPAGAFAFSHGLEKLAEDGGLKDRVSLEALLGDLVRYGSLKNDFILIAEAWRAAMLLDQERYEAAAELALALQPSSERHLESVTQGRSFMEAISAAWPAPGLSMHGRSEPIAYAIALALAVAAHDLPLEQVLLAHGLSFVSNLVSAAIRLSVIGQTDGQRVLAALLPLISEAVGRSLTQSLDDLGSAVFAVDLAALKHETQYSRLFRS